MIKHIVMWNVLGRSPHERSENIEKLRTAFEGLRGRIPGLIQLEIGIDTSRIGYSCDVVLYSEFDTQASLDAYAAHPAHLSVRDKLQGLRIARHQVDYEVDELTRREVASSVGFQPVRRALNGGTQFGRD
jgi:hypothetical protein